MRSGVERVEIPRTTRKPLQRRVQDSGAIMLIVFVRDAARWRIAATHPSLLSSPAAPARP